MIFGITKSCTHERIIYERMDNEHVKKNYYNENGKKTKEKVINVRDVHQGRRSHRNTEDFFEDMIWNHGYNVIN